MALPTFGRPPTASPGTLVKLICELDQFDSVEILIRIGRLRATA